MKELREVAEDSEQAVNVWVSAELRALRIRTGVSVATIAESMRLSVSGVAKIESGKSNPRLDSLAAYVHACGKTLGEFFEPLIPPDNPRYDRYVHGVIRDGLQHPVAKSYIRNLIGLISLAMKTPG